MSILIWSRVLLIIALVELTAFIAVAFVPQSLSSYTSTILTLRSSEGGKDDGLKRELDSRLQNLTIIEELDYRVQKLRLEEQNIASFKKAKPRFLPYKECKNWVQAWGRRWESKEEWESWIADGEKRNAYIPSDPEVYYTKTGSWEGWDLFLGVKEKKKGPSDDL